jgi:DNA invertase Pin-like site-specific DNA recombinase
MDELDELSIGFASLREGIDTTTEAGRMFIDACRIISALERSLSGEKIRQGMRRAEFEGQRLGRAPLDIDRASLVRDRLTMSLTETAKRYGCSRASVIRYVREAQRNQPGEVGRFPVGQRHEAIAECVA